MTIMTAGRANGPQNAGHAGHIYKVSIGKKISQKKPIRKVMEMTGMTGITEDSKQEEEQK